MKYHVKIVHEGKKPYKCDYCDVRFGRKPDLKKHVTNKHKLFEKSQEKDKAKKRNVKETLDESDDHEEDWGKDLEEESKKVE